MQIRLITSSLSFVFHLKDIFYRTHSSSHRFKRPVLADLMRLWDEWTLFIFVLHLGKNKLVSIMLRNSETESVWQISRDVDSGKWHENSSTSDSVNDCLSFVHWYIPEPDCIPLHSKYLWLSPNICTIVQRNFLNKTVVLYILWILFVNHNWWTSVNGQNNRMQFYNKTISDDIVIGRVVTAEGRTCYTYCIYIYIYITTLLAECSQFTTARFQHLAQSLPKEQQRRALIPWIFSLLPTLCIMLLISRF